MKGINLKILENNWYILLSPIHYFYYYGERTVPVNFYFNGGSVPRLFWAICHPLLMPYLRYFAIHDWQYSNKCEYIISRKEADLFLLYNISLHNRLLGFIVYLAVRIFGGFHFRKDLPFKK